MVDETISEKCETLYNKLNTFVESEISRDVTPQISNLNSRIDALEPNLVRVKEVNGNISSISAGGTSTKTFTVPACPSGYNWKYFSTSTGWGTVSSVSLSGTTLTVTLLNVSNSSHDISFSGALVYYPNTIKAEPHISVTATNPYLLEGEITDLVVSLVDEFGLPLGGKTVTIGQSVFIDYGTTSNYSNWDTVASTMQMTRQNTYTELKRKTDASAFGYIAKELSVTDGITIEFDLKQATIPSSNDPYLSFRDSQGNVKLGINRDYQSLNDGEWHHYKLVVNGLTVTPILDGVQKSNLTLSDSWSRIQLEARNNAVQHFKNFVIYNNSNRVTDENGEFALHNVSVTDDTIFNASYGTETASCLVEYCTFVDYMTIKNNQSDGYHIINGSCSLDDNGMTIIASTYENKVYKANVRIDGDNVCTVPFEISFDLISCSSANTMKLYAFNNGFSTTLVGGTGLQLQNDTITPIRFIVESDKITKWIGTTSYNITPSTTIGSTVGVRFGYWESYPGEAKIRNFRIKPL